LKHKVLITVPDLTLTGGVAIMFRALRNHFSPTVNYFTVGRRSGEANTFSKINRAIRDYRNYCHTLKYEDYGAVQINPSLKKSALIRDALFLIIAKNKKKKVIVFFHGWDWKLANKLSTGVIGSIFKKVFFSADAIVVLANDFAKKLQEMGYKGFLHLGNIAIEDSITQIANLPTERDQGDKKNFNILFLTRIEKYKGIYEAIDAFRILKGQYENVNLIIAGDGSELNNVQKYVKENNLKDVKFTGYVTGRKKHEVYKSASCYLLPSYSEGMPLSLIEAFAYGLPAITTPVGAIKDFFISGKMGFLIEDLNPNSIANLISKYINDTDLCLSISEFNRKFVRVRFTPKTIVSDIEYLYDLVITI
jgi:glycosyltransferase involved in cell wall biosynthesis